MEEHDVISSDESGYNSDEEAMYQQMGLIKLKDMDTIPLAKIKKRLDKKMGKKILDINEMEEEIDSDFEEINEAKRSQYRQYEQGSPSYQKPLMKPREFMEKKERFGVRFMPNHRPNKREISLEAISETGYKLNLDGLRKREEVLDYWKKSMMIVLNMNVDWNASHFLNYIEHSLYGSVADWYEAISEESKNHLRESESPVEMFTALCDVIEGEFIGVRDNQDKRLMERQGQLIT